ncbi:MAG TPA: hypothetical protein VGI07_09190 [Solirubrobacteraceae bacterium]
MHVKDESHADQGVVCSKFLRAAHRMGLTPTTLKYVLTQATAQPRTGPLCCSSPRTNARQALWRRPSIADGRAAAIATTAT